MHNFILRKNQFVLVKKTDNKLYNTVLEFE